MFEPTVKAVHMNLRESTKEFIEEKLKKIDFAEGLVEDLEFTLTKDHGNKFECEAKCHFHWGDWAILKAEGFELHEAINKAIDKLDHKVKKEKDKVQKH